MRILCLLFLCAIANLTIDAQTVLHVDMSSILKEMPGTAKADSLLQARGKIYQMKEDSLYQDIKASQEFLQKAISDGSITQQQVNAQEKKIGQLDKHIQHTRNTHMQELEKYRQELIGPTMNKISRWIAEVAEKRNASIVYDLFSGRIVYINEKLSINEEVVGKIPAKK